MTMMRTALLWMFLRALVCTGLPLAAPSQSSRPAANSTTGRICITSAVAIDFETTRVLDWVAYHHLIGVDCFVLFYDRNHLSLNDSHSKGIFEELSRSRVVTMVNSTYTERLGDDNGPTIQQVADMVGGIRYLAVVDVDEFIVTREGVSLSESLEELVGSKNHLGLFLERWPFGTNGYVSNVPVKELPEFFYLTERVGEIRTRTGKVIINVPSGVDLWGVHSWRPPVDHPHSHMLLPDGTRLRAPRDNHYVNHHEGIQPIWINHYVTGSFNQCLLKAKMGDHHRFRGRECTELHPGEANYEPATMTEDLELADGWALQTRVHLEKLFPDTSRILTW